MFIVSCHPLQIKGSGPHTPNISSALSIADEPPASRLTAQGTIERLVVVFTCALRKLSVNLELF